MSSHSYIQPQTPVLFVNRNLLEYIHVINLGSVYMRAEASSEWTSKSLFKVSEMALRSNTLHHAARQFSAVGGLSSSPGAEVVPFVACRHWPMVFGMINTRENGGILYICIIIFTDQRI